VKDLVVFLFQLVFGFFDGTDENKHKRIAALILICLMVVPAFMYGLGVYQRFEWFKHNPNSGFTGSRAPNNIPVAADTAAAK
jgi:hypothetical protein